MFEPNAARGVVSVRREGRLWFHLRLLSSLDTLAGPDETLGDPSESRDGNRIEVRCSSSRRTEAEAVEAPLPGVLSDVDATFEIPYGHLNRPANGGEEAAQAWVDVAGTLPDGRRAAWRC